MQELTTDSVREVLEQLGYECEVEEFRVRAKHTQLWNVIAAIDMADEEINMVTFFGVEPGILEGQRGDLLEAINRCNRNSTVCSFRLDGDNDLYVNRCLPASGGFLRKQLMQLVREGNREISTNLERFLENMVQ